MSRKPANETILDHIKQLMEQGKDQFEGTVVFSPGDERTDENGKTIVEKVTSRITSVSESGHMLIVDFRIDYGFDADATVQSAMVVDKRKLV